MGVEAIEMDWYDGRLCNDTRLVPSEKSRDELFTSGKGSTSVYVIRRQCWCKRFDSNSVDMGVEVVEID